MRLPLRESLLLLGVTVGAGFALAAPLDPSLPQRRVVGAPAGESPMDRVDGARSGRSRSDLPGKPRELWRARITGGLDLAPVVDRRGHVVAASAAGRVTELDGKGAVIWSTRTGSGAVMLGPMLTSDETRVVIASPPEVIGLAVDGTTKYRRSLPLPDLKNAAQPLATSDGGMVLAAHGKLLRLDSRGDVQARAELPSPPVSLLEQGRRILIVALSGDVLEWKPPAEPSKLGSFGGRVDEGAALSSANHVTAVVDHQRVVDLNLTAGTRHLRVVSGELLQGPPAISAGGETRVASFGGLLLGHDQSGAETARAALEPASAAAATPGLGLTGAPPLVLDGKGRVAFARPGLDVGVLLPNGNIVTAPGAACGDPLSLVPAGARRLLLGCRSGLLLMLGD